MPLLRYSLMFRCAVVYKKRMVTAEKTMATTACYKQHYICACNNNGVLPSAAIFRRKSDNNVLLHRDGGVCWDERDRERARADQNTTNIIILSYTYIIL